MDCTCAIAVSLLLERRGSNLHRPHPIPSEPPAYLPGAGCRLCECLPAILESVESWSLCLLFLEGSVDRLAVSVSVVSFQELHWNSRELTVDRRCLTPSQCPSGCFLGLIAHRLRY